MKNSGQTGVGFIGLLFIVFLVLKLTKVITWSWWWITAPLWGPAAFAIVISVISIGVYLFSKRKR